ncbi:mitochondrial ribosomal protein subunit L20-domain-containing protein [Phascolomyces articulosus]|uniref:Mitochondrial ribosomal protein subunit L20-domain-containing protein n=1 Tax=Phascolomyces articulosus TaxID=60185 RepID=A0AAD5PHQ3_9FUNG|nr:mitochondrial ribosomal protein subunit L20-domain-containing protein [Phascolomyces articulosus]
MFRQVIRNTTTRRCYATKSKTTNLTTKPRVPFTETALSDGSIFVTREAPVSAQVQATTAPPLRSQPKRVTTKLTQEQIQEMRSLRQSDPTTWTRKKLADKFGCSELFVSISAPTVKRAVKVEVPPTSDAGYRKQLIRKNRERRRELW